MLEKIKKVISFVFKDALILVQAELGVFEYLFSDC